jgi:hypothetical protein
MLSNRDSKILIRDGMTRFDDQMGGNECMNGMATVAVSVAASVCPCLFSISSILSISLSAIVSSILFHSIYAIHCLTGAPLTCTSLISMSTVLSQSQKNNGQKHNFVAIFGHEASWSALPNNIS